MYSTIPSTLGTRAGDFFTTSSIHITVKACTSAVHDILADTMKSVLEDIDLYIAIGRVKVDHPERVWLKCGG